jgi:prepilin-type N-terminal cleavage/methylation domain-containing protein
MVQLQNNENDNGREDLMQTFHQRKTDRGFSLIEILLAIAILAVVALGIMALLPGGYKQITNAGRSARLNHLAQMQMDYLKTLPITASDLNVGTHPSLARLFPLGNDEKYSIKWTVTDYTAMSNSKSILIEAGYDIYNTDGSSKSTDQAIEQKRMLFTTMITQ